MKQGKSITELARQLQDIKENAKDFLVPAEMLSMSEDNRLVFTNGHRQELEPTPHAHGQIASYANIPRQYYDRLKSENSPLLAECVNHGIKVQDLDGGRNGKRETRMVRAYKDGVRALLSSSYRRLDSYDMAETVLPILVDSQFNIESSEITDTRCYIKAVTPKIQTEIKKGDMVQFGLVISNSDVGAGSLRVEPLIYRLVCSNGLIANTALRKFHVGKNLAVDGVEELFSQQTLSLTDQAFWAQVRDLVLGSMRPENFAEQVDRLREAAEQRIRNFDIPHVVEMSMKAVNISGEKTKDSIINYLANGADGAGMTKWGLANGFTFAAQQDHISYDQSIELERAGSKVIDLNKHQWHRIAEVQS